MEVRYFGPCSLLYGPKNLCIIWSYSLSQDGHYGEEYDDWNSAVFRSRRNCSSDGAERTDDGRAAVTGKARSPSVVRRVDGMISVNVEALWRRRREPTSAVKWSVSAGYDGAVPIRQRYARTHNWNWILSGTFSQCSSRRSGVLRLPCLQCFCLHCFDAVGWAAGRASGL